MRSKLYCSTEPVYDFWSYLKPRYAISLLRKQQLASKRGPAPKTYYTKPELGIHLISYINDCTTANSATQKFFSHSDGVLSG